MSPPEVRLWSVLRTRPGGHKFRRQHPDGPFVLDFFCSAAALAIEIDGYSHNFEKSQARDARRDRWFAEHGVETLRIAAGEVNRNLEGVVAMIVEYCDRRTPPPPLAVPLPANSRGGFK